MMDDKNDRRNKILKLVIKEYIRHGRPVASHYLLRKFTLDVSSATIRNDLARLEEEEFLLQPHTSAGRIPTEKAYRFYIDNLKNYPAVPERDEREVAVFYGRIGRQAEDMIRETSTLLAQLTGALSLVYAPCFDKSRFKHLGLVFLSPESLLVVLITNTGAVFKSPVRLGFKARPVEVDFVERKLNSYFSRLKLFEVKKIIFEGSFPYEGERVQRDIAEAVFEQLVAVIEREEARCMFLKSPAELPGYETEPEIALIEPAVRSWLSDPATQAVLNAPISEGTVAIRVGREAPGTGGLFSLFLSDYSAGELKLGKVGVFTPLRTDYPRMISAVAFVAKRLSSEVSSYYA